ncbi:MAG TPA: hypothetical protein VFC65_16930 [Prolixibacteraceae bacterium]|nr:hypothetical protein [Prolixibacteraceae bacterium]
MLTLCANQHITGIKTTPPTMAITDTKPPILVLGPSCLMLNAKIVGYISYMKKLVGKWPTRLSIRRITRKLLQTRYLLHCRFPSVFVVQCISKRMHKQTGQQQTPPTFG